MGRFGTMLIDSFGRATIESGEGQEREKDRRVGSAGSAAFRAVRRKERRKTTKQ